MGIPWKPKQRLSKIQKRRDQGTVIANVEQILNQNLSPYEISRNESQPVKAWWYCRERLVQKCWWYYLQRGCAKTFFWSCWAGKCVTVMQMCHFYANVSLYAHVSLYANLHYLCARFMHMWEKQYFCEFESGNIMIM